MERLFAGLGAISAFAAVALGAFGAHALKNHFENHSDLRIIYGTAVDYHVYHALALFAVAWAVGRYPGKLTTSSGFLFLAGTVIFSGSLYLLSVTGIRWLGAVTPIGGASLLAGWCCLAVAILFSKPGT